MAAAELLLKVPSKMSLNVSRLYLKVACVFITSMLLGGGVILLVDRNEVLDHQRVAMEVASIHGHLLQEQTARSLSATYALAAVLRQGNGHIDNFDAMASEMLKLYGGISSLQLAPRGVIRSVVPLKGNEAAMGHDLLQDPERNKEAFAAVVSRKLTLAGPFNLRQGGVAVVGRLPVFIQDSAGVDQFWGFTTSLIKISDLLSASRLGGEVASEYEFELAKKHPDLEKPEVFWSSSDKPLSEPMAYRIAVPNGEWHLSISRIEGWHSSHAQLGLAMFVTTLTSLLAAFLALHLLRQPHLLAQVVALRTRELSEANDSLQAEIVEHWNTEVALRESESQLEAKVQARTSDLMTVNLVLENEKKQQKVLINKLAAVQNELLQSKTMASIGQLAAGVAHEINNPISFISSNIGSLGGFANGLLDALSACEQNLANLPTGSPQERQASTVQLQQEFDLQYVREELPGLLKDTQDGVARVKRIVQDLKDFSNVDQAAVQLADLNHGLDSTLNMLSSSFGQDIGVVREYGGIPLVECVSLQINQVFLNLLLNAAQAIDGAGTIRIGTVEVSGWVQIEIADTGCGIDPEHLPRIFDPFFSTKPVGAGTGLGLSLSYSIVDRHGGRIEVESVLSKGSVFRVWLPVTRTDT
jgi:signal transduction histidine kinase